MLVCKGSLIVNREEKGEPGCADVLFRTGGPLRALPVHFYEGASSGTDKDVSLPGCRALLHHGAEGVE
jgi:hypothetical protein